MSRTVGLHPLLVFFAVLGGAKIAGVWGAVFGIPIVGVASAMASFYRAAVEQRRDRSEQSSDDLPTPTHPENGSAASAERSHESTALGDAGGLVGAAPTPASPQPAGVGARSAIKDPPYP
jgi:hypothetical protein